MQDGDSPRPPMEDTNQTSTSRPGKKSADHARVAYVMWRWAKSWQRVIDKQAKLNLPVSDMLWNEMEEEPEEIIEALALWTHPDMATFVGALLVEDAEHHQAIAEGQPDLREEVAVLRERVAVLEDRTRADRFRAETARHHGSDDVARTVAEARRLVLQTRNHLTN